MASKTTYPPLPEELTTPYKPGDDYFVARKPFLINKNALMYGPDESALGPSEFLDKIGRRKIKGNDVFVGIAGLKSLDILATAGKESTTRDPYQHVVLFDVNWHQTQAMNRVLELVKECPTAAEFKERFVPLYMEYMHRPEQVAGTFKADKPEELAALREEQRSYFNAFGVNKEEYQPQTEATLRAYLKEQGTDKAPHSWLEETNYKNVRGMVESGKIKVINMDVRDEKRREALQQWLDGKDKDGNEIGAKLHVGDMYISSVVGFMDPYLHTDYHSKPCGLAGAQKFYKDLLALVDDKGEFIVSNSHPDQQFMQTYHLNVLDRTQMQDIKDALPNAEPEPHEKHYDYIFGTKDQAWQVMSMGGDKNPDDSSNILYFRITSERPPADISTLQNEIVAIDTVIDNVNAELKRQGYAQITEPASERVKNQPDTKHFARMSELAERMQKHPDGVQDNLDIQLSSKPFVIDAKPGQDPADTLRVLEAAIKKALGQEQGLADKVVEVKTEKSDEPPEIVVPPRKRSAAQRIEDRRNQDKEAGGGLGR